jgi:protein-disulfide isomerase
VTLKEALAEGEADVRVVFRHMPLSIHPWARAAAEAAGCAELQSNSAFWSMHDRIFESQGALTAENAHEKLSALARSAKGVDAAAFEKCMAAGMSVGLVLKDMDLAERYQINSTPTVFINGHWVKNVDHSVKLRELIAQARKEATAPAAAATVLRTSGTR